MNLGLFLRRNRYVQNALHGVTPTTLWILVFVVKLLHKWGGTGKGTTMVHELKPGETLIIREESIREKSEAASGRRRWWR